MADPNAVVSPGGVGFDINCGVRLIRTNLSERDVAPIREQLAQVRKRRRQRLCVSNPVMFSCSLCLTTFLLEWARRESFP